MRRLSEYVDKAGFVPALHLADVQNEELLIKAIQFGSSRFGPYALFTAERVNGEVVVVITSAKLVLAALERVAEDGDMPIAAKFVKRDRYWAIE